MKVELHPEAKAKFLDAVEFYANESTAAANRLIDEFEAAAAAIENYPSRYRKGRKNTRIIEFHSFPYSLVYRILDDLIKIDAVAHNKHKPGYWRKRI